VEGVDVGELSAWHWAVVVVVAVLLFGSQRLPDAARSLGRSARILRAELRGGDTTPGAQPPADPPDRG
jgi:sec-independent protein translocase protein TatA